METQRAPSFDNKQFDLRHYCLLIRLAQNDYEGELNLTHVQLSDGDKRRGVDISSVHGMKVEDNEYALVCKFDDEAPDIVSSKEAINEVAALMYSPSATACIDLAADVESLTFDSTVGNIIDMQLSSFEDQEFSKTVSQVSD
jgi:hypothetical protein